MVRGDFLFNFNPLNKASALDCTTVWPVEPSRKMAWQDFTTVLERDSSNLYEVYFNCHPSCTSCTEDIPFCSFVRSYHRRNFIPGRKERLYTHALLDTTGTTYIRQQPGTRYSSSAYKKYTSSIKHKYIYMYHDATDFHDTRIQYYSKKIQ